MQIRELDKKDFKKVIQYAVRGMHFDKYAKNNLILKAYGRYFWYLEYTNATQVIAAYDREELLGVLTADMKGEPKNINPFGNAYMLSWWRLFKICFLAVV